jgi:hypothetical protein
MWLWCIHPLSLSRSAIFNVLVLSILAVKKLAVGLTIWGEEGLWVSSIPVSMAGRLRKVHSTCGKSDKPPSGADYGTSTAAIR